MPAAVIVPQLFQAAVVNVVQALNGFMKALPNPVPGNDPIVVPVYPAFQDPKLTSPACLVSFRPGAHDFGAGESWDDTNMTTGVPSFQVYAPGCKLTCSVYTHLPGMTGYVADMLYSSIIAAYSLNPLTGEVVEDAVGKKVAEAGLTITGLLDWSEVEADPESKRPYGQFFQVHQVYSCNLDIMWSGGTSIVGPIQVLQQVKMVGGAPITEEYDIP